MKKKLMNIVLILFGIAGLLLCCSGEHVGNVEQVIQNIIGVTIFSISVLIGAHINQK